MVNIPKGRIVGDEYKPYLVLSNAHDGSACLKIFLTGIRIVCNNTLTAALNSAKRRISIKLFSVTREMSERQLKSNKEVKELIKSLHNKKDNL